MNTKTHKQQALEQALDEYGTFSALLDALAEQANVWADGLADIDAPVTARAYRVRSAVMAGCAETLRAIGRG